MSEEIVMKDGGSTAMTGDGTGATASNLGAVDATSNEQQQELSTHQAKHAHAAGPNHSNHAHHLKWGEIETSGFAPPEEAEDEPSDLDDPCHHTQDRTEMKRKKSRDRTREMLDSEARRIHASRRYLFRKPRPLQYFRGKVLVRSAEERGSGRLELFFDLTFVGIIAVLAQSAIADPTGPGFVRYLLTYTAAYMIWNWMREIFDSFYKDDLTQRILVLFVMACLVLFGNNAISAEQTLAEGPARAVSIASYLIAEAAIFGCWFLYSFYIKAFRAQIRVHTLTWLASSGIWIGCIFVDVRAAIAMAVVAMVFEWHCWQFFYSPTFKRLMRLRYSSAIAIEHEIERYQDFFTIVMGEFVYSLFDNNPARIGFHASAGKAIMALMIAFCFQLFYMNGGWSKRITHPLRHSVGRAIVFFDLHLPIVSALTLCGDAMADFIREDQVPSGVRWMACESYAVGMIGLWAMAMIEHERDEKGELWLPKPVRLAPRFLSGLIAIFLPFTHHAPYEEEGSAGESVHAKTVRSVSKRLLQSLAESAEGSAPVEGGEGGVEEVYTGINITTGKLLGILTALAVFTLLWETITSLDGPNAPEECAPDHMIERANEGHGVAASLSTPSWRGFPRLCEPGSGTFDHSHQRDHGDLSRQSTNDSSLTQIQSDKV